jgi:hypothetical protein
MEILRVFIKILLFLIGGFFLVGGLFCGAIGISSGSGWMFGLIGLLFAALGGFLVALPIGLVGKKKPAEQLEISGKLGEKRGPPDDAERGQS